MREPRYPLPRVFRIQRAREATHTRAASGPTQTGHDVTLRVKHSVFLGAEQRRTKDLSSSRRPPRRTGGGARHAVGHTRRLFTGSPISRGSRQ
ncbi:hypothetical protein AXF42_Ash021357 [Apostasia shenzhenica]|uniref:Uncharacterized protein n=1 Tax=Apostasia shenzhenica TaxID=1088818 RepID=A0A2H9ZSP4_9ASPA|nr:hypothetical protein AXF42_Ash021348 [Apostasia shenzhenica]PKA46310.1 hypothetical protein AXF42_Ash021357 [Apostasia shenzhenica]